MSDQRICIKEDEKIKEEKIKCDNPIRKNK